jgi:hypothetical protein
MSGFGQEVLHSWKEPAMADEQTPTEVQAEQQRLSCGNCGTSFEGNYCPRCGQSVRIFERPLPEIIRDLLGDLFAFDTRFWRSASAMLLRPGTLVAEYVGGRHIRYVPPFRAYVFVSFLFFLLLHAVTDRQLDAAPEELVQVQQALDSVRTDSVSTAPVQIRTDGSDEAALARVRAIAADPAGYIDRLLRTISWSLFLLMPLLGGLLWLFFRQARPFYLPHFLFAINLHTTFFLLLSLLFAIALLWPGRTSVPERVLLWLAPVHLYAGARQLYRLKAWPTTWRLLIILLLYLFLVVAVTATLVLWSILGD